MAETVVITGASSGIGLLTAEKMAQRGANLVLAGRDESALERTAARCAKHGVMVEVKPTDVTIESQVEALAETAITTFGEITAWVNIAGVTALDDFAAMPSEDFNRVIETNFHGTVYGSRAALKQFYLQGYGTLINTASVLGGVPIPYESPYVASKYAVRGFTASLRQEVYLSGQEGIAVCTVLPATMATPIYKNAANRTGTAVRAIPPVYKPEMVADAIVGLMDNPKSETVIGKAGMDLLAMNALASNFTEKFMARYIKKLHYKKKSTTAREGNLFKASEFHDVRGEDRPVPRYTDAVLAITGIVGLAVLGYKTFKRSKS